MGGTHNGRIPDKDCIREMMLLFEREQGFEKKMKDYIQHND